MSSIAVFGLVSADTMTAILRTCSRGELQFSGAWPAGKPTRHTPTLLLAGFRDAPVGAEWAAFVDSVSSHAGLTRLRISGLCCLTQPVSTHRLALDHGSPAGLVPCSLAKSTESTVRNQVRHRWVMEKANETIRGASQGQWKEALLKCRSRMSFSEQVALATNAAAPGYRLPASVVAQLVGVHSSNVGEIYAKLGGFLAQALGAGATTELDTVVAWREYHAGVSYFQLRRHLGPALRELGWPPKEDVLEVVGGDEDGGLLDPLLLAAAAAELEAEAGDGGLKPTQRKALQYARIGQGPYRKKVSSLWGARCAVTELAVSQALIASHILPWSKADNRQRLDPYNGLFLAASLDRLFDGGFISFSDDGRLLHRQSLTESNLRAIGISEKSRLRFVHARHQPYLQQHRSIFGYEP